MHFMFRGQGDKETPGKESAGKEVDRLEDLSPRS